MTLARVRAPTCEARPAAWKASPITYTPPWKYRTIWPGSIPSTVISAVGTPPSVAAVTVTSAGQRLRREQRFELSPLLVDVGAGGEGSLPQDCVEVLFLFGAHGGSIHPSVGIRLAPPRRARPRRSGAETSGYSRVRAGSIQIASTPATMCISKSARTYVTGAPGMVNGAENESTSTMAATTCQVRSARAPRKRMIAAKTSTATSSPSTVDVTTSKAVSGRVPDGDGMRTDAVSRPAAVKMK